MSTNFDALERLRSERDKHRSAAAALAESDDFDPESEAFKAAEERAAKLDTQIERLQAIYEQQAAADLLDAKIAKASKAQERKWEPYAPTKRETWGEAFVRSADLADYQNRGFRGTSAHFTLETAQERALPTGISDLISAGFKGAETIIDTSAPALPTPLLDAISNVMVSGNAIEYVAWRKVSGEAAVVPEKGAKPPIEWGPSVTSTTLDNIAGYTQLTRQMIEDFAAIRSKIDGELQREVLLKEEREAAAALTAATLPTATGTDLLRAIRVGIGTVESAGYAPNAVLLNPADWAALDMVVMDSTNGGATVQQRFWGLTPIPANSQAAGTAIVGDFKTGVDHYTRSNVSLYVTDSHADTFLANVFTLLAERRSKTVVVRPQALVEVSGPAPA